MKLNFLSNCIRSPHNCKTCHLTSWIDENLCKMYKNEKRASKACANVFFSSLLNMQICDILFALVVADVHVGKCTFFGNGFF